MRKLSSKLHKATAWLLALGMTLSAIQPTFVYANTETPDPATESIADPSPGGDGNTGSASIDLQAKEDDPSVLNVTASNSKDTDQVFRLHLWEFDEGFFEDYDVNTKTPVKDVTIAGLDDTDTVVVDTKSGDAVTLTYTADDENKDYYLEFTATAQSEAEFTVAFEGADTLTADKDFVVEPEAVDAGEADTVSNPVKLAVKAVETAVSDPLTETSKKNEEQESQTPDSDNQNAKSDINTQVAPENKPQAKIPTYRNLIISSDPVNVEVDGVVVTAETSKSQYRDPSVGDDGTLLYYTGETARTTISVSNPSGSLETDGMIRIFMNSDDAGYNINWNLGTSTITVGNNSYEINVLEGYCVEIPVPAAGDTISFTIGSAFASGTTGGGDAYVSAEIEEADGTKTESRTAQKILWNTRPNAYPVTKSIRDTWTISGSGNGDGIVYLNGLSYAISVSRSGDTLEGIGEDPITKISYADTLTLPDGWTFTDEVKKAVKAGNLTYADNSVLYGDKTLFSTTTSNTVSYKDITISDDGKEMTVVWESESANAYEYVTTFGDQMIYTDEIIHPNDTFEFINNVTATESYTYSEDQTQSDQVSNQLTAKEGSIDLSLVLDVEYDTLYKKIIPTMGQDAPFIITLKNTGVTTMDLGDLTENIPRQFYLSPDGIESMFASDTGDYLNLTITNATITTDDTPYEVTGFDGGKHQTTIDDTWSGTIYDGLSQPSPDSYMNDYASSNGATITFTKGNDCIVMSYGSNLYTIGENGYYKSVEEALNAINFKNTYYTQYTAFYNFDSADKYMLGGETITINIPTIAKSSFMMLTKDAMEYYSRSSRNGTFYDPINELQSNNTVQLKRANGVDIYKTASINNIQYRMDLSIDIYALGEDSIWDWYDDEDELPAIEEGTVSNYLFDIGFAGQPKYESIPLVNQICGPQVLMVPAEENKDADWVDRAESYTPEGDTRQYYLLTKEGVYRNVHVGKLVNGEDVPDDPNYQDCYGGTLENKFLIADKVVVEDTANGIQTTIYWYLEKFNQIDFENNGTTYLFMYYSLLNTGKYSEQASKYYSNVVYLGDYQGHRLVDSIHGASYEIDKDIVTDVGDTDTICKSSLIGAGDTVTYRLKMFSTTDNISSAVGSEMSDILPLSIDGYRWTKDNVKISYSGFESVSDETESAWTITDAAGSTNQQTIKWNDDFEVSFNKPAYIWVTVTYPDSTDWDRYENAYRSTLLTNTFKVDGPKNYQASVSQVLRSDTEVVLQKGVYATGSIYEYGYGSRINFNTSKDSRLYYPNSSAGEGLVTYYIVLYNDGESNLYLSPMTDVLPEGYTFWGVGGNRSTGDKWIGGAYTFSIYHCSFYTKTPENNTLGFADVVDTDNPDVTYKSATVRGTQNEDGTVTFNFTKYVYSNQPSSGGGNPGNISYDETVDMVYLQPGEAIQFAYTCETGSYKDTLNESVNSIAMPIYNRSGGNVSVGDSTVTAYDTGADANDGSCSIISNAEAVAAGFTDQNDDTQWVTSDVTVYRGGIKPGISKVLSSAESQNGTVANSPVVVDPTDTLKWDATINNDGTNALVYYTVTDELPYPYTFTGDVSYQIYGPDGNQAARPVSGNETDNKLFTIKTIHTDENGKVDSMTIAYTPSGTIEEQELIIQVGEDPHAISIDWKYGYIYDYNANYHKEIEANILVSLEYNDNNNLCLSLEFPDDAMGIMGGGYGVLSYHTINQANDATNRTYVNKVYVTPKAQYWDGSTNVGNYVASGPTENLSSYASVRNSCPVTVATGYVTTSYKTVTEKENDTNTASSTSRKNYIMIDDPTSPFTYQLVVDNVSDHSMDKLILIDNLPEVGDHDTFNSSGSRESDFAVSIAENPDFKVVVSPDRDDATWQEYTLDQDQYTIQYNTKTQFTSDDWSGVDGDWTTYQDGDDLSKARSIRLTITDDEGSLIPSFAKITLSFTAKADSNAKAGEYAWNSFGYHYSMVNSETELEAAPLEVGVAITGKPIISKSTVDKDGNPEALEEDATYRYILYKGHYMTGIDGTSTVDDVVSALKEEGTEFSYIELNVPAGETVSDQLSLADIYAYGYSDADGFTATDTPWTWENDASYTLWEIPSENYTFDNVNGGETINNAYTFTYTKARNQTLECVNELVPNTFDIRVNKYYSEDVGGTTYAGAVGGAVLQVWNADKSEMIDEQTVDDTGYVTFAELEAGDYVLVEAEAPDHFLTANDIAFTVNKDGTITTENSDNIGTDNDGMFLKMKDEMENGTITIRKYEDDGKTPLAGVTYKLYDADDQVVDTKTTGEDGTVTFTDIPFGDYTIVETATASGYNLLTDPIKVTIPLVLTSDEADEKDADTTQAFYDKSTDSYIFFAMSYDITDDVTFVMPTAGGNNFAVMALGGMGALIVLAGAWMMYRRKKGFVK